MAAVVHGCTSPRQRHSFNSDRILNGIQRLQAQHHPLHNSTPMYSTKYGQRSAAHNLSATTNHHTYPVGSIGAGTTVISSTAINCGASGGVAVGSVGGSGGGGGSAVNVVNTTNQYGAPVYMSLAPNACITTAPISSTMAQQRPLSASAVPDMGACQNYWSHQHSATMLFRSGRHYTSQKSAVEILAATKPLYVKSDVFERLQQSNYRTATSMMANNVKRSRHPDDGRYNPTYGEIDERCFGTAPHVHHQSSNRVGAITQQSARMHQHHHHHHGHGAGRHNASTSTNILQNKLRMLLGQEMNKDRSGTTVRNSLRSYEMNDSRNEGLTSAYGDDDTASFHIPPPLYMSTQPYSSVYNYAGESNSGEEPLVLTENYRPISPPAEYAAKSSKTNNDRYRHNYHRSYSHSHEMDNDTNAAYGTTDYSHKSLPDLHTQISRHSPHSENFSCCSRGNRSIKSAGESSLNRDSGGSSGHYTHRSEPCYQRQREAAEREINPNAAKNYCNVVTRRDSGSSTQHSANSYCGYAIPAAYQPPPSAMRNISGGCGECRCKHETMNYDSSNYLLNFTTPEVPEAFQDDYTPPTPSPTRRTKELTPRYSSSSSQQINNSQGYTSFNHSQSSLIQSPGSAPSIEDISPPPIEFKRQRCIRFKSRGRLSHSRNNHNNDATNVMAGTVHSGGSGGGGGGNSGSGGNAGSKYQRIEHDNVFFPKGFSIDDYHHQQQQQLQRHHGSLTPTPSPLHDKQQYMKMERDNLCDLEKFFDRLGLNDEMFHEIYNQPRRKGSNESESDDSSTVFFSDVSTVDSMRLPDSTETQPQSAQPYRPSEPPSIVERNARIIKWLCNCKKLQYT